MSRTPRVSVVVCFLNGERFIEETIDSVFRQTYTDWELVLVDDGSTDRSTGMARRWAAAHPERVRYLEHPGHVNRGLPASRNVGIRVGRGSLIATLDADDVWRPRKLEEQVAVLDRYPEAGMVFGASEYWNSWTGAAAEVHRDVTPALGIDADRIYEPPSLLVALYPLGRATAPCPSDLLMRRSAVERVGGFEEDFHTFYEDQAFLTKVYLHVPVYVSSASWLRYRLHEDSDCQRAENNPQLGAAEGYHRTRRYFLEKLDRYLRAERVSDPAVWGALRQAQFPYRFPRMHAVHRRASISMRRVYRGSRAVGRQMLPPALREWLRNRLGASA